MYNNIASLEKGFTKAGEIIQKRITGGLIMKADVLCMKAHDLYRSPNMAFTGNTWTGTAVGVYVLGKLVYYVTTKMIAHMSEAIRRKLTRGESSFLYPDYMGVNRYFTGKIKTDRNYSEYDALEFLKGHSPLSKYAITVVNGSEYAEYIEQVYHGDVITGVYHYANKLRAIDLIK